MAGRASDAGRSPGHHRGEASTGEAERATAAEKLSIDRLAEVAAERDAKELARKDAAAISKFLDEVFKSTGPSPDKRTITVNETLDIAAKKLETELADQPAQRAKLQATLGNTFMALGFVSQAIPLKEKALDYHQAISGPEHPDTVAARNNLASTYFNASRWKEALKLMEEGLALSLKKDPNSLATASAYERLGYLLDATSRQDEALAAWQEMARINPKPNSTHFWLGKVLADRRRFAEALPFLRNAQSLRPEGLRALETAEYVAMSEAMLEAANSQVGSPYRGSSRELLTLWLNAARQTVAANPSDTEKAKRLATIYFWLGQTNEHESFCRKQLELSSTSEDPKTLDRAAKSYLLHAHPNPELVKLAVAPGRQALKLSPPGDRDRPWFMVTAAMAAVRDGKPAEAETLLTEAVNLSDGNSRLQPLALGYRAIALAQLGRTNEARADFAALEKFVLPLPAREPPSPMLLNTDQMAICIAFEEARELLNPPRAAQP